MQSSATTRRRSRLHAILYSSTWYQFFCASTDGRHVNPSDVKDLPCDPKQFKGTATGTKLARLSERLEQSMKENTLHWPKSGLLIESVNSAATKPILSSTKFILSFPNTTASRPTNWTSSSTTTSNTTRAAVTMTTSRVRAMRHVGIVRESIPWLEPGAMHARSRYRGTIYSMTPESVRCTHPTGWRRTTSNAPIKLSRRADGAIGHGGAGIHRSPGGRGDSATTFAGADLLLRCPGSIVIKTFDTIRELRDAGTVIVVGFQSPMERECFDFLLRGDQPVIVCPAKGLTRSRLPNTLGDQRSTPAGCSSCPHSPVPSLAPPAPRPKHATGSSPRLPTPSSSLTFPTAAK